MPGQSKIANLTQPVSWKGMLEVVPVRNEAAKVTERVDGEPGLIIEVPNQRPGWYWGPLKFLFPMRKTNRMFLDGLGANVWLLVDGKQTVEEIIEIFAQQHALSFHEGRVLMTQYLKNLTERGATVLALRRKTEAEPEENPA